MAKTWEATAGSTDFVITTVNVPDRLDVQEVRAREDEDDDRTERFRIDWYAIRTWVVRLIVLGLVAAAGLFAWESALPLREELSANRIAQRLSQAMAMPVRVASTDFKFTPTPRFVVSGVEVGDIWRVNSISLQFNWEDAWRAVRGGGWVWGEASVGPTKVTLGQAEFLMRAIPRLSTALPASVSTVRFESVEFEGLRELPGVFDGVARRNGNGAFGAATLRSLDGKTVLNASLSAVDGRDAVALQFDANNWRATVGPAVQWNEVHATLRVQPNLIEVPEFLLVGYFGAVKGAAYAANDKEWAVTGTAAGSNFDIEAILRQAAGGSSTEESRNAVPLSGTAGFDLVFSGRGASLNEAIDSTVAKGPIRVKWVALNGINLGYVATRPGSQGGGQTRFTDLTAWVSAGPAGVSFQDLNGRAGALSTRGEVAVAPDRRLSGSLRVDLGGTRIQAPLNVQVRGTLLSPEFGR